MMVEQHLYKIEIKVTVRSQRLMFHIPKNVPNTNGDNGTPKTGAVRFINQFGKRGVIRRNNM